MGNLLIWLVVEPYPSGKYEFVSWDDNSPNIWKKKMFQTTNQIMMDLGILNQMTDFMMLVIR